ncbi:chromate efflux transporter [Paracoccus sp. p4-l81]|uniref:chromate efflux transporter n=1 Tax=unclassified Paracoccus (in: a-proteobacteria) TaxID=2688777 RepID=UPI0035B71257
MTDPAFPSLRQATAVWARIALLSFGGPAGQIAVMHRILVQERRWLGDGRFLHALNFCMVLPGPEAMQLATYIGWLMHGVRGALIAGGLFILPGVISILALSWVYAIWGQVSLVAAIFLGLKAAVLAIVVQAVIRLSRRALRSRAAWGIAIAALIAIMALRVPFPVVIAAAALIGLIGAQAGWRAFQTGGGGGHGTAAATVEDAATLLGDDSTPPPGARRAATRAGIIALIAWLAPVAALLIWRGPGDVFADLALFFSKMAVLTFGGAYAVLAWVAQEAVATHGWLRPGEMLDGLGMAETTPGPLIMVLQFVGFMAALRGAGWDQALWAGTLGGLLTTWVTFLPCFALIFLGAPHMEALRQNRAIAAALSAVTAAVVGVIANLAIWFALHVIWTKVQTHQIGPLRLDLPVPGSLDPAAAGLAVLAMVAVFGLRMGVASVLAISAAAGLALHLAGLA